MSRLSDLGLQAMLGTSVVEMAESRLGDLDGLVEGDRRVVRVNLIAFFVYAITWGAAGRMEGTALRRFRDGVASSAADQSGVSRPQRALETILNRYDGFATSLQRRQSDEMALSNYFQACCSVNRMHVDPEEVYPHPDDMDHIAQTIGALTEAGRQMQAKVRAMREPAVYRMNFERSMRLESFLTNALTAYKELIDSYDL